MYLKIQKKANAIILFAFIALAAILYGVARLISEHTEFGIIITILCFICIILLIHLLVYTLIRNLENILIFKMIGRKQIALAKVKKGEFYKTSRDPFFFKHEIYKFEAEVYTQNGETKTLTLYEDVKSTDFSALPGYLYVTYGGNGKNVGIVPTFYIYLKPILKDNVQNYEKLNKPRYVEVIKHKGMTINSFKKKK